jgi:predicted phosphodiesterase
MGLSADGRSFHMRIAVLSDIHGNLHALDAVLADVEREDVHEVWCLGDIVGYGADPNDCCARVRDQADVVLSGNHDMAVTGELSLEEFSRGAAIAARWTQEVLRPEHAAWLRARSPAGEARDVGVYHGSPRDPVWEYVLSSLLAELCFDAMGPRLGLVGHSHVALSFVRPEGEAATGEPRRGGDAVDLSTGEWILNPGSVGQPRDGDSRAAWLLLDLDLWRAQWRRTEYDVSGAQAAIRNARLPASLAERLEYGQ